MYDYTNNKPLNISNQEFLSCVFAGVEGTTHVTDFTYDPNNIPQGRHLASWMGDHFQNYRFNSRSNQYFTISQFDTDDKGTPRRRKVLFKATYCIVLDDVKEKLPMSEVVKLPEPTWILETSPGSEQWGYVLDTPATDRSRVENLLDGLVSNGLAPQGKDPGMKGVTRYVRLPEGFNMKKSKAVNGAAPKCGMLVWEPFTCVTLEQLAKPFNVNLDAVRREGRIDGASNVPDHPLLDLPDLIHIKEIRSDGRYDVTCPWVEEHTGADDSGAAIFTNDDGTMGFKCHHGACAHRTGRNLLTFIEESVTGFRTKLSSWQVQRAFAGDAAHTVKKEVEELVAAPPPPGVEPVSDRQALMNNLIRLPYATEEADSVAAEILKSCDNMTSIQKIGIHKAVRDHMRWNQTDFKAILTDLRSQWYEEESEDLNFYDDAIYISEQNQLFDREKRIFYTAEAFQNTYGHLAEEARKNALIGGCVTKVDKLDYAPLQPRIFKENGIKYGNSWTDKNQVKGVAGDVTRWLEHFKVLGWADEAKHLIQWMAWTIRHPDKKINHMILLGSKEGGGKDFILQPLITALAHNSTTISGDELLEGFNEYILGTKHLNINEVELGDRKEAAQVANKLKPLCAAPPETLRLNRKGISTVNVRNILSVSATTNSQIPVRLTGTSRRIFAVWSDVVTRDHNDEVKQEWKDYWKDRWTWMVEGGGAEACIEYLENQVDLSDFNPQAAPPMTTFLREIVEAGKSPVQVMIDTFIREGLNVCSLDLITARDLSAMVKTFKNTSVEWEHIDIRATSPQKLTNILKNMNNAVAHKVRDTGSHSYASTIIWCIRNHDKYSTMQPHEIFELHQSNIKNIKQGVTHLKTVTN